MTSQTPDQAGTTDGPAPRRSTRRRVTRPTSAPQPAPEPIVVPARASDDAPQPVADQQDTSAPAAPPAGTAQPQAPAAPARRSRRATRGTAGPATSAPAPQADDAAPAAGADEAAPDAAEEPATGTAEPVESEPVKSQPVKSEPARADAAKNLLPDVGGLPEASARRQAATPSFSLDDIVLPDGPGSAQETAEPEPPRRRRSTRATKAAAPRAAADAPAATDAPADTADADVVEPEAKAAAPKRRRASRTTGATSGAAAEAEASQDSGPTDQVAEPTAEKAPRKSRAAGRAQGARSAADTEETAGSANRRADTAQGARRATTQDDTAKQPGGGTPRLATTALLFQAPDLSTGRRSRRAQAPAGPPRFHDAPAATDPTAAEVAEIVDDQAAAQQDTSTQSSGRSSSTRSASRSAGAKSATGRSTGRSTGKSAAKSTSGSTAEEPQAQEGSTGRASESGLDDTAASQAPAPIELTAADEEAVGEIAEIETELVAEGVELIELGPEDFTEDGDEADIRPRRRRRRGGRGRRGGRKVDAQLEDDDETSADSGDEDSDDRSEDSESEDTRTGGSRSRSGNRSGSGRPDAGSDAAATGSGRDSAEATAEATAEAAADTQGSDDGEHDEGDEPSSSSRRRRRRRRGGRSGEREARTGRSSDDEVVGLKGSTRLEAKRQRRREGRDAGRRRQIITEAEFLARREAVSRSMIVREESGRTQIAVLEDGVLTEHYVSAQAQASMVGNVYLGRVQNVLPSMEAAFVDVGKGRNAVLYAGEVNWDAAGIEGQPRRIEEALKSGDSVLVQVTKDPIGHKGARLTSQITLAGRYLVFVPGGGMTGISRKLPDNERNRLKKILREVVPDGAGVIVRTAAEGASEDELRADVERLQAQWESISEKVGKSSTSAPSLLQGEPDMSIRVVRDIFNDDFSSLVVQGERAWSEISTYVAELAPDLRERVTRWTETGDVFAKHRVDEQLAKGMDRKVWLPSGGSLVIDRTEAMTVIDVNTGKFTGTGGTLEETVTRNNLEAAEEIVRQLRLRDIGGIIVIDFVDMVLESNRDLVLRRLVECLGRDRTKHQVAEVTSLGLVQMTRKRVGQGLVEAFSSTCEHCKGRGFIVHDEPIERGGAAQAEPDAAKRGSRRKRPTKKDDQPQPEVPKLPDDESEARKAVKATLATIAAAAAHAHEHGHEHEHEHEHGHEESVSGAPAQDARTHEPVSVEQAAAEPVEPAAAEPAEPAEPAARPGSPAGDAAESGSPVEAEQADPVEPTEPAAPAASEGPAETTKGAGAEGAPEQAPDETSPLTEQG
ncbi:Rne/Rng family ribonuclease [Isoptericola jiangsuensis]|uniref:Rne/Rng family ribonuclease n=1 Tax=Isoptericola jiangsuensis TaxID=548579 RepID=UPI003AAD2399